MSRIGRHVHYNRARMLVKHFDKAYAGNGRWVLMDPLRAMTLMDIASDKLIALLFQLWGVEKMEQSGSPVQRWLNLLVNGNRPMSSVWFVTRDRWRDHFLKKPRGPLSVGKVLKMRKGFRHSREMCDGMGDDHMSVVYRIADLMIEERLDEDRELLKHMPRQHRLAGLFEESK